MKCLINGTTYDIKQGSLRALYCLYYTKFVYEEVWELYQNTENILFKEIFNKKTILNFIINPYCKYKLKLKIDKIIKEYNKNIKDILKKFVINDIKDSDINGIINAIIMFAFNEDDFDKIKIRYEYILRELSQCDFNSKDAIYLEKISNRVNKLNIIINKLLILDTENKDKYIETYIKYEKYASKDNKINSYKDTLDYIDDIIIKLATILKISKEDAGEMTFKDYVKVLKNDNNIRAKNSIDIFMANKGDINKHIKRLEN
jgi:hypothetical protein